MGSLSQKEGPVELVIARDYKRYWPKLIDTSCFAPDKLFLMKTVFHPGQFLCGQADPEAVGTKMRGVKRRLTQGTGESAGSSTSSSRRPRELTPVADPLERRLHDPPSPIRGGGEEKKRAKSPSPRSTSLASTDAHAQPPQEMSVPSRGDKKDMSIQEKDEKVKSVEKREDESPVRRTPAKKKRARKMSSSSDSGNSSSGCSSDSNSSSEDEATAEIKIIDKSEEEQLSVLEKKRAARKELRRAVREHDPDLLLKRARAYTAPSASPRKLRRRPRWRGLRNRGRRLRLSHQRLTWRRLIGLGAAGRRVPPRGS
jgi:hypothetical protein